MRWNGRNTVNLKEEQEEQKEKEKEESKNDSECYEERNI